MLHPADSHQFKNKSVCCSDFDVITENSSSQVHQNPSKLPAATSTEGCSLTLMSVSGSKLPGVSAWREGQKLARKLLGPPPAFPRLRSRAEEQSTGNAYGTAVLSATLLVSGTQTKMWLAVCGMNGFKVFLSKCKRFKREFHCPCMLHSLHTPRATSYIICTVGHCQN